MRTFTPDDIQRVTLQHLNVLREHFPDESWSEELATVLTDLHGLAGNPERDAIWLRRLEEQAASLLHRHNLKGLEPILWMITSLQMEGMQHLMSEEGEPV